MDTFTELRQLADDLTELGRACAPGDRPLQGVEVRGWRAAAGAGVGRAAQARARAADAVFDDGYGVYSGPTQFSLGPGSIQADPLFDSPTNLRLDATSPAIDTGLALGYSTDVEGNPVPADKPNRGTYKVQAAQIAVCPDFDADGYVDVTDIARLTAWLGSPEPPAPAQYDIAPDPPDGFVDITDVSRMTGIFGQSCS